MKLAAAAACAFLALLLAAPAAAMDFGATEDAGKTNPDELLSELAQLGMARNVVSLTWDAESPTSLPPDAAQIDRLVAKASARGIRIAFALYQRRATDLADAGPVELAQLSTWLQQAARRWPAVREWIGFNEPNQPRFFQPQFGADCAIVSAAKYAEVQGTVYDALKTVDGTLRILGVALSPRGNDRCDAPSNRSTSPVRFLEALGRAYRATRAAAPCRPLMDALSVHPYPNANTDPPRRGHAWPNFGIANLDRVKQAFWDAFAGTCQATVEDGLRISVDEFGYQTASGGSGYDGDENVPVVDEETQARYYAEAVGLLACDPSVSAFSIFHLVDEPELGRMQTGLLRADWGRKPSWDAVRAAVAAPACAGAPVAWRHTTSVLGAKAFLPAGRSSWRRTAWTFSVSADEQASYAAAILPAAHAGTAARLLAGGSGRALARADGTVLAHHKPLVRMKARLRRGKYVYAVRLRAATNPARASMFVSRPFTVG